LSQNLYLSTHAVSGTTNDLYVLRDTESDILGTDIMCCMCLTRHFNLWLLCHRI